MKDEVLFLKSPLKEKIYGGNRIQKKFGFLEEMNKKIGEYWAISAHDNGVSIITNTACEGQSLKEVYEKHRELFHHDKRERFPLLVKINEITSPVSVQVHPDDAYAKVHEHDLGKAEFCLFLDVDDGTKLVRGHRAKSRGEFQKMALEKRWDELLIRKEVKTGDFVYTPAGVVHGVEGKMLMAEVQQSSDVTYRIYDYDNVDVNGKPRELHLEKALDVVTIPHEEPMVKPQITEHGQNEIQQYIDNAFFRITKYGIHEAECIENETYSLCLVLDGKGTLITGEATYGIGAGMSFIMTSNAKQYTSDGNLSLLVSEPGMVKGE